MTIKTREPVLIGRERNGGLDSASWLVALRIGHDGIQAPVSWCCAHLPYGPVSMHASAQEPISNFPTRRSA